MKSRTRFLCMKKLGMMWASQQVGEKNPIATLMSLVKITDGKERS